MRANEVCFQESSEGRAYVENAEHPADFSKIILDLCKAKLETKGSKNRYERQINV
jgi:hypothetical protein